MATAPAVVDFLEATPASSSSGARSPTTTRHRAGWTAGRAINPLDLPSDEIGDLRELVRPEPNLDRAGRPQPDGTLIGGRALIGRLLLALQGTGHADLRTAHCRAPRSYRRRPGGRCRGETAAGEILRIRASAASCWPPAESKATPNSAERTALRAARGGAWDRRAPTPAT